MKDIKITPDTKFEPAEKDVRMTTLEKKYHLIAEKKLQIPVVKAVVTLNDAGKDGDEIPQDGKYSGYFRDTKIEGIYSFRFMARDTSGKEKSIMTREKTLSVLVSEP